MVTVRPVFLLLLFAASTAWGGHRPHCLDCHPPHYEREGECITCHRGDDRTNRKRLAHRELLPGRVASFRLAGSPVMLRGEKLVKGLGCRRCHRIGGTGNGVAADLDVSSRKPLSRLREGIDAPSPFMPTFRLSPGDRDAVVTFLIGEGTRSTPTGTFPPQVVHFGDASPAGDPFSLRCGGCHRMLSRRQGALGKGVVAPDLSGLFSPYYPLREGFPRFNGERLLRWIENPRSVAPRALMPPLHLSPTERLKLTEQFAE